MKGASPSRARTAPLAPLARSTRLAARTAVAIFACGFVVAGVFGLGAVAGRGPGVALDRFALDGYVRHAASTAPDARRAIVVDIDEVSLSAVGQWPWPRYRIASLIEKIAAARPAAIGLDVLFAEPDRSSLVNIRDTFKRDFDVDVAFSGVPDGLLDNDGYLGFVMRRHDVVASNYFYFDHFNRTPVEPRSGIAVGGDVDALTPPRATGVLVNTDAIASATRLTGFMNDRVDDDGVLRRLPLLVEHGDQVYPSLALATVMKALGVDRASVRPGRDGPTLAVGAHRVPIDDAGFATLAFGGGKRPDAIGAVDVLAGRFAPEDFAGRIVFVGSSAVGLNDVQRTAVDPRFPGLMIHAVAATDLLDDRFVREPRWGSWASLGAAFVVAAVVAALFAFGGGVAWSIAGTLGIAALATALSLGAFVEAGWFIGPAAALETAATLFVVLASARYAIEKRRALRWLRQLHNARQVTIESMASVAETRDPETGAHIKRTQHYVKAIALSLRSAGEHVGTLTDDYIHLLFVSAPLHDIGKVGVPDHILLKPGRLTPAEFEIMKQHAEFGRRIIRSSAKNIDGDNFLELAGEIAATHHEKWDGTGYPLGLAGEAIPLSGRIMAVADIYDALISRRCYKEPFSHELATSLMREARGTIFDPTVLAAFFRIESEIREIAFEYSDEVEDLETPALPIDVPREFVGTLVGA